MNIASSLHTHTVFSDGNNTPREMIGQALRLGLAEIVFTDHAYTFFDESYCMRKTEITAYQETIAALKEEYKDRILVRCGIEQDYDSEEPAADYEFVIGSVHYVKAEKEDHVYIPVDESLPGGADILKQAAQQYFDGDIYALTEAYFESVGDVVNRTGADLIGHFDVVTKCNTMHPLFDPAHPRYRAAWQAACDKLLQTGIPFEINVSPMLRGIKPEPYPSEEMQAYIRERGGTFCITGDCHSTDELEQFVRFCREHL